MFFDLNFIKFFLFNKYIIVPKTVKNFVNLVAKQLEIAIYWKGKDLKEKAIDENGKTIVACDKAYYRPIEVNTLLGDSKKAFKKLKWKPKIKVDNLIKEMIAEEMKKIVN